MDNYDNTVYKPWLYFIFFFIFTFVASPTAWSPGPGRILAFIVSMTFFVLSVAYFIVAITKTFRKYKR